MSETARARFAVRAEHGDDASAIRAVVESAFPSPAEANLVDALRRSGDLAVSLVATSRKVVVGHVAFSPVTTFRHGGGAGLAPLAVMERSRRRGIGEALVRAGLEACREAGFEWVVVLGSPRYYSRFGFETASRFGLLDEYDGGNAFQALALPGGAIPRGAGLVRYAPAFATL